MAPRKQRACALLPACTFPAGALGQLIVTADRGRTWCEADASLAPATGLILLATRPGGHLLAQTAPAGHLYKGCHGKARTPAYTGACSVHCRELRRNPGLLRTGARKFFDLALSRLGRSSPVTEADLAPAGLNPPA